MIMNHVFVTFLGVGGNNGYDELKYAFHGQTYTSKFAQWASMKWLLEQKKPVDKILVFVTKESREKHLEELTNQWLKLAITQEQIYPISISTNQDTDAQWVWFQELYQYIDMRDKLYFDFTHGFRSVPIIFSTAIGFLQKSKSIQLQHAFYGYKKENSNDGEIVDMAPFYQINDWADGVAALVESADVSKISRLAEQDSTKTFSSISDPKLIQHLQNLNILVQSIDMERIPTAAQQTLERIEELLMENKRTPDQHLLMLISDKFQSIAHDIPLETYDIRYFECQLRIIQLLLKHNFLMQACTAMRELIGSIVLTDKKLKKNWITQPKKKKPSVNKQEQRRYSEIFINMCQFKDWNEGLPKTEQKRAQILKRWNSDFAPFQQELRTLTNNINKLRNGFDHAWLKKKGVPKDVQKQSQENHDSLKNLIEKMHHAKLIPSYQE